MNFAVVAVVAAAVAADEVVWHPFGPAMYSMLMYF